MRRTITVPLLALALLLAISTRLPAQIPAWNVSVPSPTAASLGKFGDIPVSLYTGVPDITVPLFAAKGKTLALPIALQYHASGIRVDEIGGWAGMGWALQAGGAITRTMRGITDEWTHGYWNTGNAFYDPSNWPTPHFEAQNYSSLLNNIVNHVVDGEPDDFFFDFAGQSGQFVIGPTSTDPNVRDVRTRPYRNWLIQPTIIGDSIVTWVITTEDGTRYTFAAHETHIDYSPMSGDPFYGHPYASSWFLTEVRSPAGDVITLQYVAYLADHDMGVSQERIAECNRYCDNDYRTVTNRYEVNEQRLASITAAAHTVTFMYTMRTDALSSGVHLVPAGTQQEPRLDKVVVSTPGGTPLRQFQLVHDYSIGNRLTLKQVFEQDANGVSLPPYAFRYAGPALPPRTSFAVDHWGYYNGRTGNTELIPSTRSSGSGMWYLGASRVPDPTLMQAGVLTRITYPTGGYNQFVYEPNDYSATGDGTRPLTDSGPPHSVQVQSNAGSPGLHTATFTIGGVATVPVTLSVFFSSFPNPCTNCPYASAGGGFGTFQQSTTMTQMVAPGTYQIEATEAGYGIEVSIGVSWHDLVVVLKKTGGGLRVAEVDAADAMGNVTVHKYKYALGGDETQSSGMIQHEPKYDFGWSGWVIGDPGPGGCTVYCPYWVQLYSRSSISKMPLGSGPPIGYSEVTEWLGPSGEYGKTRHSFTFDYDPSLFGSPGWPFLRHTTNEWRRGQETGTQEFDAAGRIQREVSSTYAYPTPSQTTRTYHGMAVTYWPTNVGAIVYAWNAFEVASAWRYRDGEVTTTYDTTGTTSIAASKTFVFGNPNHAQLTEVRETNSDGTQRISRMKYALDYPAASGNPEAAALTGMQGPAHMHSQVIERTVSMRVGASEKVVQSDITTFRQFLAGQYLPYQHFVFNSPSPVP
jgi:hypothetical protein